MENSTIWKRVVAQERLEEIIEFKSWNLSMTFPSRQKCKGITDRISYSAEEITGRFESLNPPSFKTL